LRTDPAFAQQYNQLEQERRAKGTPGLRDHYHSRSGDLKVSFFEPVWPPAGARRFFLNASHY